MMKINEIRTTLKAQTCNLFSEEWYNKTSSLLAGLSKDKSETNVETDPRFERFQIGVKYYNSEIPKDPIVHMKTLLIDLKSYCASKGLKITKGKTFKGRFFIISE